MIPDDLYFTRIKISSNLKNALVCKKWYMSLKSKLREAKIQHYDRKLYDAIMNKVYTNTKMTITFNIIALSNEYYTLLVHNIMMSILKDNMISLIMKKNIIEYYKAFAAIYEKYQVLHYCDIDMNIAEEYKNILIEYYDCHIS